jgi:hypothetical protein
MAGKSSSGPADLSLSSRMDRSRRTSCAEQHPSLNFFKERAKDFIEFKKIDHYLPLDSEQVLRSFTGPSPRAPSDSYILQFASLIVIHI